MRDDARGGSEEYGTRLLVLRGAHAAQDAQAVCGARSVRLMLEGGQQLWQLAGAVCYSNVTLGHLLRTSAHLWPTRSLSACKGLEQAMHGGQGGTRALQNTSRAM